MFKFFLEECMCGFVRIYARASWVFEGDGGVAANWDHMTEAETLHTRGCQPSSNLFHDGRSSNAGLSAAQLALIRPARTPLLSISDSQRRCHQQPAASRATKWNPAATKPFTRVLCPQHRARFPHEKVLLWKFQHTEDTYSCHFFF